MIRPQTFTRPTRLFLIVMLAFPGFGGCRSLTVEADATAVRKMSCLNKAYNLEGLCDDEIDLLDEANADPGVVGDKGVSRDYLRELSEKRGISYATAVFFQRVNGEKASEAYIKQVFPLAKRIQAEGIEKFKKNRENFKLVMVPAMFYNSNSSIGGDGSHVRAAARAVGMSDVLIEIKPDGRVEENARYICDWLDKYQGNERLVMASISKGSLDVKRALQLCGGADGAFKKVEGWLNFGGINRGSRLINEVDGTCLYRWRAKYFFYKEEYDYQAFLDAAVDENSPLYEHVRLPENLKVINVIATPLWRHVTLRAEEAYKGLAKYGPNDGLTILADSYMPGAINLSFWGTDHYFAIPERRQALLYAALLLFTESGSIP